MDNKAQSNIVRVGIVHAVDPVKHMVRAQFPDTGVRSGWLFVLQHLGAGISVATDESHNHPGTQLAYWLPRIGERVLVLYIPVFNGDGFVLGGI